MVWGSDVSLLPSVLLWDSYISLQLWWGLILYLPFSGFSISTCCPSLKPSTWAKLEFPEVSWIWGSNPHKGGLYLVYSIPMDSVAAGQQCWLLLSTRLPSTPPSPNWLALGGAYSEKAQLQGSTWGYAMLLQASCFHYISRVTVPAGSSSASVGGVLCAGLLTEGSQGQGQYCGHMCIFPSSTVPARTPWLILVGS